MAGSSKKAQASVAGRRVALKPTSKAQAGGAVRPPPKDATLELARRKGLQKAKETNRVKSVAKRTDTHAGTWAQRNDDLDKQFVLSWLDGKTEFYGFLAGMIRNGILEQEQAAHMNRKTQRASIGKVGILVFTEGATKWKNLKVQGAIQILAGLYPTLDVPSWFRGDCRLEGTVAVKAVKFLCGVQDNTLVPHGHAMGANLGPISGLIGERIVAIGSKVKQDPSKDTLDEDTNWWQLLKVEDAFRVVLNDVTPHTLDMSCVDLSKFDDWTIVEAGSFADAYLWSEKGRFPTAPLWRMLPDAKMPIFDEAFHYPATPSQPSGPMSPSSSEDMGASPVGSPLGLRAMPAPP